MLAPDSVALVTGAAAGIGRATALAFARAGSHVALADLDRGRGEQVAEEIRAMGRDALFVALDVADAAAVEGFHRQVQERFGRLDYACNNAGIEGEQAETAECSIENFDRVINVNLRSVFLCMKHQLALMLPRQRGAIVNMASVAGLVGFPNVPAYCASKGGVVQLTKAAALEYAQRGIRVNVVCPAVIKTDMVDRVTHQDPEIEAQYSALHPIGRMGTADEVADAVIWLCSDQASFVTGHALPVDGGMLAR